MQDFCNIRDPFGDELGHLIRKVVKLWHRALLHCIEEYNITVPQLEVLGTIVFLKSEGTEITQIALSQETGIDPMTTSTIIRNLQKKNLVTRKESTTDTRARIVDVTDEGFQILAKSLVKIKVIHDEATEAGVDREFMKSQLQILYNNLNNLSNNDKN